MSRKVLLLIAAVLITAAFCILRTEKTILYIPLDNRPVNYDYVIELNELTGLTLLIPPREYLNGGELATDNEALWQWLLGNAGKADSIVLSLDTLYFGGLIPSRVHNLSAEQLAQNTSQLEKLLQSCKVPVYAFSTIMRSATGNESAGHPPYFREFGAKLSRLSELTDKKSQGITSPLEEQDYARLIEEIPQDILDDYLQRRKINKSLISKTLKMLEQGLITYYIVSRDDSSQYSYSKMDTRNLEIHKHNRAHTYPGADQIGALLFARAVHKINGFTPKIQVIYGAPGAEDIIPRYEDIPLGDTVAQHIVSLGGIQGAEDRDLSLIINMPAVPTQEATLQTDTESLAYHRSLHEKIQAALLQGIPVALADVAYANGADDALMRMLAENDLLLPLAAYSGWNTAGNSIGTALAHGSLYSYYHKRPGFNSKAHQSALLARIAEDWLYQSVIRPAVLAEYDIEHGSASIPEDIIIQVEEDIRERLNNSLESHFPKTRVTRVKLPWNRLFELNIDLEFTRLESFS